MKIILLLAAVIAISLAKSVTLLKRAELTDEMINNPRYLLWETEEGLFEVEDLQSNETAEVELSATENDVSFFIYTFEHPTPGVQINESQIHNIVKLTGFDVKRPTLVVIHGWKNNNLSPVNDYIKTAALKNNKINVIVADWSSISRRNYVTAQGAVLRVGNYIGDFLVRLDNELNHRLKKVTIVGHSLGAHISGNAGARLNGTIETIIGLDPAGPLFSQRNINNRLDPTDAKYVHVIHTNNGLLGFKIRMGHVDYHPNGGKSQPGCRIDLAGSCAHARAYAFFAESLYNDKFSSKLCDTYRNYGRGNCANHTVSLMGGYPISTVANGEYFLNTNSASPYAQG